MGSLGRCESNWLAARARFRHFMLRPTPFELSKSLTTIKNTTKHVCEISFLHYRKTIFGAIKLFVCVLHLLLFRRPP